VQAACAVEGMIFAAVSGNSEGGVVESYGVVTAPGVGGEGKGVLEMAKGAKGFLDAYAFSISEHRCWARESEGLTEMVAY